MPIDLRLHETVRQAVLLQLLRTVNLPLEVLVLVLLEEGSLLELNEV